MSSAPTADEIARDATWLAQALDPAEGMVRLIAMDPDGYRAASFLDDRILQVPVDAQIVSWPLVEEAITDTVRSDARWIFHIGHVGSTLVSRLLRDLALTPADVRSRYIAPAPRLMSRTFAEAEVACVKATSFASEIAPELVPPGERALFMYASPHNYVASILAGENSVEELHLLAGRRSQRLNARGIYLPTQNDAGLAAAAWATEAAALEAAAEAMPDRQIAWADFDAMLGDMPAELARIAGFFGFDPKDGEIASITSGPVMNRYSKAPEYDYSATVRRELIGEATERHRRDIDAALAMLRSAAEKSPLLARALARARGD